MSERCPGCQEELYDPSQHWCGDCGEPLNVDVDRNRIRRQTDGFLDVDTRNRIMDSIVGDRGPHHEYTHVRVQEQVRSAMLDLCLLNTWDEFDNREAILSDMQSEQIELTEEDEQIQLLTLIGSFQFFMRSVAMEFISEMVFQKLRHDVVEAADLSRDEFDESLDISLELVLDGDSNGEEERFTYESI